MKPMRTYSFCVYFSIEKNMAKKRNNCTHVHLSYRETETDRQTTGLYFSNGTLSVRDIEDWWERKICKCFKIALIFCTKKVRFRRFLFLFCFFCLGTLLSQGQRNVFQKCSNSSSQNPLLLLLSKKNTFWGGIDRKWWQWHT